MVTKKILPALLIVPDEQLLRLKAATETIRTLRLKAITWRDFNEKVFADVNRYPIVIMSPYRNIQFRPENGRWNSHAIKALQHHLTHSSRSAFIFLLGFGNWISKNAEDSLLAGQSFVEAVLAKSISMEAAPIRKKSVVAQNLKPRIAALVRKLLKEHAPQYRIISPPEKTTSLAQFVEWKNASCIVTMQYGNGIAAIFPFSRKTFRKSDLQVLAEAAMEIQSNELPEDSASEDNTMESDDRKYMSQAMEEMKKSRKDPDHTEKTDPLVGVVLVNPQGDVFTSRRGHLRDGDHAEETLLERLLPAQDLEGSTIYVTLEPCSTRGSRTSCSQRLCDARIKRVFIGMLDPNPSIEGQGVVQLKQRGIEVRFFDPDLELEIQRENSEFIQYWKNTHKHQQEAEEHRLRQTDPFLQLNLRSFSSGNKISFQVSNQGGSPALNIRLSINGELFRRIHSLGPGQDSLQQNVSVRPPAHTGERSSYTIEYSDMEGNLYEMSIPCNGGDGWWHPNAETEFSLQKNRKSG